MSETTGPQRAAFAYMINKGRGVYVGDVPRTGLRSLLNDANRLAAIEPDYQNALAMIRMRGVPEQRAEHLAHALDVLLTRLDREIHSHRVVESAIEAQVLWRTEDMPENAVGWFRGRANFPHWVIRFDTGYMDGVQVNGPVAPEFRPDEPGPLFLPILDPPE